MAVQILLSQQHESVDALESNALGHQEFNQPETRFQLQRSNEPKYWNILFVALPSPNTKKNHPKWDLGKDFFPILYRNIKDQNPSIFKDFTKTFLKLPRDGLETTWRQCWSSGLKNVLPKLLSIPYCRLKAGFSVCWRRFLVSFWESSDWDWIKYTRCERFLLVLSLFICCCCCCFLVTWKLLWIQSNQCQSKKWSFRQSDME